MGGDRGDHCDCVSLQTLAADFFVVLWEQRRSGLSQRVTNGEPTGPTQKDDQHLLGQHFSLFWPLHLLGYFFGGAYSAHYIISHPDCVAGVVLADLGALNPEAAARANVAAVNVGSGELHEVLNTTDYSRPDSHAPADCFFVIALADFKDAERPPGSGFLRLGL